MLSRLRDIARAVPQVGLDIYPLSRNLCKAEAGNTWLFVRQQAKELWSQVLERDFQRSTVVGSPGIGKSFSTAYFLKRLLEKGKLVVYEVRSEQRVFIFVPPHMDGDNEE